MNKNKPPKNKINYNIFLKYNNCVKTMTKNIIIAGAGWYGCHIAHKFQNDFNITILEKKDDIFNNSSYFNQNRLHLGYHYPRNFATRNACKENYKQFLNEYDSLVDCVNKNFYVISNKSLLDYQTYKSIYTSEGHDFVEENNLFLNNIDGTLIKVEEKVINSKRAYDFFKTNLSNVKVVCMEAVNGFYRKQDKIHVNTESGKQFTCDYFIDCTYNQLQLSNLDYTYEVTLSLLYKKINDDLPFDAITIMDGQFSSLYPREIEKGIYTLTDVEHTPLFCSNNFDEVNKIKITEDLILTKKTQMESKFIEYYSDFLKNFEYCGYFTSNKTKLNSGSAFRDTIITEIEPNVISVNCGKIYGIFKFENFIKNYLKN